MKLTVIMAWIASAVALSAAPKFGEVRVTDIYRSLPSTVATQKRMQAERDAIPQNTRAERFRTSLDELRALETQLRAIKDDLDSELGKKLVRTYEIKRQEAETLRQAFDEYKADEEKRINTEMVAATRESLNRISDAARQIAEERNLDGVFDTSGKTNTGVPFVLYAAKTVDLTEDVVAFLDEKPLEEAEETPEDTDPEPQPE